MDAQKKMSCFTSELDKHFRIENENIKYNGDTSS